VSGGEAKKARIDGADYQAAEKSNDVCYKCNKTGHWASECPNQANAGAPGSAVDDRPPVPNKNCKCGAMLTVKTSNTPRNPNRRFYSCQACSQGFEWYDPPSGTAPGTVPAGSPQKDRSQDVCYKCNQTGHWASKCPNQNQSQASSPGKANATGPSKQCPCGAGLCSIRVSNTPRNPGRQYYKCPASCNYFEWVDGASATLPGSTSGGTARAGQGSPQKSSQNCYKCGQDGHWARDCTGGAGGGGKGGGGGGKGGSGCYKCGGSGHWARDCPGA